MEIKKDDKKRIVTIDEHKFSYEFFEAFGPTSPLFSGVKRLSVVLDEGVVTVREDMLDIGGHHEFWTSNRST